MLNPPTHVEPDRTLFPPLARAFSLVPLALAAMGTANAFAQSPEATASDAQPAAPPASTKAAPPARRPYYPPPPPYYYAPPPYYYYPPPPGYPPPPPDVPPAPRREPTFLVGSLAAGGGTPYGMIGGGFTFGFDYLSVIAGAGSALFKGFGWGAGLRAHVLDTSHRWRPHFTAVYGTTCLYKVAGAFSNVVYWSGVLRGFGFYAGVDHDFGEIGAWFATYGLGYITHEDLPASVRNAIGASPEFGWSGGFIDIEVAIGYRFGGK